MRIYEELFIVKPNAPEEEVNPLVDSLTGVITQSGGKVEKVDKWGTRKLAYQVGRYTEGDYILIEFNAGPAAVKEIERRLRVSDLVVKFITVRVDEKRKKIAKRQKAREKRAARKPVPVVAPPPAIPAVPAVPAAPAAPMPAAPIPGAPVESEG